MNKINVFVVDDSAFMRKVVSDFINGEEDMQVISTARNGQDLLDKLLYIKPDVITLDAQMPVMDGISVLKELKKMNVKVPVIILSGNNNPQLIMEYLDAGIFDFVIKPSGSISLDLDKVKNELLKRIRAAYDKQSLNKPNISTNTYVYKSIKKNKIQAVAIGASTGGPKALSTVISSLPSNIGVPIFIVQHMPAGFTKAFAERLNLNSKLNVVEAEDMQIIERNTVYVAPGGFHMTVGEDKKIHLNKEPPIWGVRPAVDKLFISASKVYTSHLLSVVLTGMGKDGANGTVEVKNNGGITIAQDKLTATIYGMPKVAYETGKVDIVASINDISREIVKVISGS